ncbi:MAG: NAD(P)H-hydrate dehydratase [Nitrospirota bacterium]
MKIVTAREMQEIDRRTIEGCGIPSAVLMERAGLAVAGRISEMYPPGKLIVLAGAGNNGGDGIVVGRELHDSGWHVKVLLLLKEDKLSPDCLAQYRAAKQIGVPIDFRTTVEQSDLHAAVVVDALFGTGLSKEITGPLAETIDRLNDSGAPVIAVDIPSGVASDNGHILGTAVRATATVTFGAPKRGHFLYPGADYTGELFVEDIGFPMPFFNDVGCELLEARGMRALLPPRPRRSHKGDYGHVLVVAGSRGKTGAAFMAARACLMSGCGLVTLGVPEGMMGVFQSRVTEEMCLPLPDRGDGTLSSKAAEPILGFLDGKADALAIGPGIGVSEDTKELVRALSASLGKPAVLDADALNALQGRAEILRGAGAPVVLTPHPGEFSRLAGKPVDEMELDRIESALAFSKDYGVTLVLKGVPTVVADPGGRSFLNPTGNPSMAKAGTGDVLTGMAASFLGQGLGPAEAASLAVYLHGVAGDLAEAEFGLHSVLASDIIGAIPDAFRTLRQP